MLCKLTCFAYVILAMIIIIIVRNALHCIRITPIYVIATNVSLVNSFVTVKVLALIISVYALMVILAVCANLWPMNVEH